MFPGDLLLTNTHKIQDQNRSRREWGGGVDRRGGGGVDKVCGRTNLVIIC